MAAPPYPPPIKVEDFKDKLDEAYAGEPPEARVARFAKSLEKKGHNTLVLRSFGLAWLQLTAGSAKSKSFGGSEKKDGKLDFHYAPGVEDLTLKYHIDDPKGIVLAARLQLFRRFDEQPLWERDLTAEERADGDHAFRLELGAGPNANFPDMVPTAEHSPYKLKLTTSCKVRSSAPCAWTYFQVLVHDVTLELGEKKVVPVDGAAAGGIKPGSHRTLYDTLGGKLPATGKIQKLELVGNLFKTSAAEMYSNAGFDHHQTQWGDGPLIPVVARLRLRKSNDAAVDAPLGLGNVKCLWDWVDVAEVTRALAATPALYVSHSVNYDKGLSKPKGDNCHKHHGGKRTPDGATDPVFPAQAGFEPAAVQQDGILPFKVEAAATRKWAALSSPWRQGAYAGRTGVFFQPSRMAGDACKLACYVAWEKDKDGKLVLDVETDLKDLTKLQAVTGTFVVWRKHILARYIKKKNFAMNIPVAAVQAYYEKAYIKMHKGYASIETMDAATYNAAVTAVVAGFDVFGQTAVDASVNQHATGNQAVTFRSYASYQTALRTALGLSAVDFAAWLSGPGAALDTADKYEGFCDSWGMRVLEGVCDKFISPNDGVTLCQFIGVHNIGGRGGLNGYAADLASATRQRVAFITCATPNAYTGAGNANRLEQTTTHEIGHHLFMPHAPDGVGAGGGPAPDMHDQADHNCTMSYNFAAERRWCGFCILRLRGWDKTNLDKDGTKNKHP